MNWKLWKLLETKEVSKYQTVWGFLPVPIAIGGGMMKSAVGQRKLIKLGVEEEPGMGLRESDLASEMVVLYVEVEIIGRMNAQIRGHRRTGSTARVGMVIRVKAEEGVQHMQMG